MRVFLGETGNLFTDMLAEIVDLGIAPGGWSQVVRAKAPKAKVVGIDLLPTEPIEGVTIFEMDFMDDDAPTKLEEALDGPPDLVLSDMAANTVGHKQTDHLRTMALAEAAYDFAARVLKPGGAFAQEALQEREACQTPGEPQGLVRVVRRRSGFQRSRLTATVRALTRLPPLLRLRQRRLARPLPRQRLRRRPRLPRLQQAAG